MSPNAVLWVSSIGLFAVLVCLALLVTIFRYLKHVGAEAALGQAAAAAIVAGVAKEEARGAYQEAYAAHGRLDRMDVDLRADRQELRELRASQATIKGWVKFVMHRDLSEEIKRSTFSNELDPLGKEKEP